MAESLTWNSLGDVDPKAVLRRLHDMTITSVTAEDLPEALDAILAAAIELHGADFGNIQLLDPDRRELRIVAQEGFEAEFLKAFSVVGSDDDTACGRALRTREPCGIDDISKDARYAPYLDTATAAGYCAVRSVPLICSNADLLGVLSTHFRAPRKFTEWDRFIGQLISRQAADLISNRKHITEMAVRDRNKDRFLTTLGHELRNPLGAIHNSLELVAAQDEKTRADALAVLRRQSDQLLHLVDDLLDLERVKHGKFELRCTTLDVAALVEEVSSAYRGRVEQSGVALNVTLTEAPLYANADRARLQQVLENLLDNSLRFTERGRITIDVTKSANYAQVTIQDTGTGIDPDECVSVFEPYYQTSRGKAGAGSLGFGLALVKGIVEKHAGKISARSDGLGNGSAFTFTIPLAKAGEAPAERAAPVPVPRSRRILVVDDEPDNADTFGTLLELLGQNVETAYDGKTALELAHELRPEIAFIDLSMPNMDGHELALRLREKFSPQELVLVALTGFAPHYHRSGQQDLHFAHHLLKPAKFEDVATLLNTL